MSIKDKNIYRFLLAGGGTGGHLFPVIAVAEQILLLKPEAEILFVGTKSKIEGKVVPALGYKFKSIWIKGFARKLTVENLLFPLKLVVSLIQSFIINLKFKPSVAIGSGGYASGPAVFAAAKTGAKVVLIENNSLPGITTKLLEKHASEIHVSFEDTIKHLQNKKRVLTTGNPVRVSLNLYKKEEAVKKFGLSSGKKTLLVIGGSLGARTINEAVFQNLSKFVENDLQVIWQTGSLYFEKYSSINEKNVYINPFIDDMAAAYSVCDLLLARAGATTIAEITTLGIPAILVPSPNVAENHQYHNAKSLSDKNAVRLIKDDLLTKELFNEVSGLINHPEKLEELKTNAKKLGKPDAAKIIAERAVALAESKLRKKN